MKNPLALIFFLLPLQFTGSADALHAPRPFMACVLPGMDDALDLLLWLRSCFLNHFNSEVSLCCVRRSLAISFEKVDGWIS